MADRTRANKRASSPNWLASLVGAVFLISAGFALGLVVGVVREEPDLVLGHVAGQGEQVPWSNPEGAELPDVAAGPVIHDDTVDGAEYGYDGAEDVEVEPPVISADDIASPAYGGASESASPTPPASTTTAKRAPQTTAAPTAASGTGFSVQVGAFAENSAAEEVAGGLRSKGYPVYVTPSANPNDGRWRVRVGPLPTRGEADEIAGRLKTQERLPTWVLIEGGG